MNKIENIIEKLADDTRPVCPLKPLSRFCCWSVISIVFLAIVIVFVGIRPDISVKLESMAFMAEMMLAIAAGLLSALAAHWLSLPDGGQKKWIYWLPFVPLTVLFFFAAYQYFITPMNFALGKVWVSCANDVALMALVPAIIIFLLIKYAASTKNLLTSVMAMTAVASFSYLSSRLICGNDDINHLLLWHYFPAIIVALIGAFLGNKLLRW